MDGVREWVMTLCACAVTVSIADVLMTDGAVKKTARLVLSLITAICLTQPLTHIKDIQLDSDIAEDIKPYTQPYAKAAAEELERSVKELVGRELEAVGITVRDITLEARISDDDVSIGKVRVTLDKDDKERIEEAEDILCGRLGFDADVRINGVTE